ncbi:MAG: BON domain-containing protein [Candidatus Binatia bacterium]
MMRDQMKLLAGLLVLVWTLAGCGAGSDRTVGQSIDDTNTTAAVKARLARDEISSLFRIDVDSNVGVITLNGNVRTPDQIKHVEGLVRGVKGVKDVVNKLQVQPR